MKIILFKSEKRQTPFAPEWEYIIAETKIEDVDFYKIRDIILSKEQQIISTYEPNSRDSGDGYTGLGANSLTSRFESYNVLNWEELEIKKLKKSILYHYIKFLKQVNVKREETKIQCWANVMRKGQSIKPHLHNFNEWTYLSGHITVACENTSTVYIDPINQINYPRQYFSKNEVGGLSFFQQNIPHYTTIHEGDNERVTIAFDIILSKMPYDVSENFINFDDLSLDYEN